MSFKNSLRDLFGTSLRRRIKQQERLLIGLREDCQRSMELTARVLDRLQHSDPQIRDLEYRVSSQFGDDGILAFLSQYIPEDQRRFVEFGVEDYAEANTRLLMTKKNWSGLVLDGSAKHIQTIQHRGDAWRFGLDARHAFITRDNINQLLSGAGYSGPIGVLSVDIDGNDYWVWEAIQCVKPAIVVCEYNALFGDQLPVSVPYDPAFVRQHAHSSHLYFGCSLAAAVHLASRRNLRFIGTNSAGNNAYFVHQSLDVPLPTLSTEQGFTPSVFREGRDATGQLTLQPLDQWRSVLADLPLVNVVSQQQITVGDLKFSHSRPMAA